MNTIVALILLALLLFFFEILIPGGILALMGCIVLAGACVVAYLDYGATGALFTVAVSTVLSIVMFWLEMKIISRTRFGQRLLLKGSIDAVSTQAQADEQIIGKSGESLTTMAPTGMIVIESKKYEAFSEDGLIAKGMPVQVVSQDNFRLIVRKG